MNDDIERALRASLAENAKHAPRGDALAERILAETDHLRPVGDPRGSRPRRWRSWTLPLIASGAVAAVVGAIVVASQLHTTSAHPAVTPTPRLTTSAPVTPAPTSPEPTAPTTASSPPSATSSQPGPGIGPVPNAFRISDLTFVSANDGWALGSGQCFNNPSSRCIAVLRTSDGGKDWVSVPNPGAHISINGSCADPCVTNIRFATKDIGYAFGPSALFVTIDGGTHWRRQSGGASSLEVENGTALRSSNGKVQIADVGGDSWQAASLPSNLQFDTFVMRSAHNAYVLTVPASAGGDKLVQHVYASTDDGKTWTDRGDPCSRPNRGVDITHLAAGADGSVSLLCEDRQLGDAGTVGHFVRTSTDGGATFGSPVPTTLASERISFGAADSSTLFYVADALYRSTDGGASWKRVGIDATTSPGNTGFLGFENPTTGRWVTGDGSTVWTTTDAGVNWTAHTFS